MSQKLSELDLFLKYHNKASSYKSTPKALVDLMGYSSEIDSELLLVLDLDVLRNKLEELLDFLMLRKRFEHLVVLMKGDLLYGLDDKRESRGFIVSGHAFETLDEVERAWKNKALL